MALLDIRGLRVGFGGEPPILAGLDLTVGAGETVALVGESGSGKSLTALSIMGLLPRGAAVTRGSISFEDQDVLAMGSRRLNRLRGGEIAMLFQQPLAMLDPSATVGSQVAESVRLHTGLSGPAAAARVIELFREVGIAAPEIRARSYAHQLSGGMAQRVMIASALAGNPRLLIADEPTTALDVTAQLHILDVLTRKRTGRRLSTLLITHDLGIVSAVADRIVVLYGGRVVERGGARDVLQRPRHPYTQSLVRASLLRAEPEGSLFGRRGMQAAVTLRSVEKHYTAGPERVIRSLDGVDLEIRRGEALGLVGESGCGKSTLARVLLRMEAATSGEIHAVGHDLGGITSAGLRQFHRDAQLIFQDPAGALDPRMRLGESLLAPLQQNKIGAPAERRAMVLRMMAQAGLAASFFDRLPRECSGGQLQRAVIARALLMRPKLLVCDEPTSALDASIRAQILNLLRQLRAEQPDLTVLMITHDLRVVRHVCDRVAVMYLGEIVELADVETLFARPAHPYTQALIASSLLEEHGLDRAMGRVWGEPPSPLDPPRGCRFHARCHLADERCARDHPALVDVAPGHAARCWHGRTAQEEADGHGRQRRNSNALPTTLTLLSAIAAPAITGSSSPEAASGMPRML